MALKAVINKRRAMKVKVFVFASLIILRKYTLGLIMVSLVVVVKLGRRLQYTTTCCIRVTASLAIWSQSRRKGDDKCF